MTLSHKMVAYVSMCACCSCATNVSKEKSLLYFYCFRCVYLSCSSFHKLFAFIFFSLLLLFVCYSLIFMCAVPTCFLLRFISVNSSLNSFSRWMAFSDFKLKACHHKFSHKRKGLQYCCSSYSSRQFKVVKVLSNFIPTYECRNRITMKRMRNKQ